MCTLSLDTPLPGRRVQAFVAAFKAVNSDVFATLVREAAAALGGMSDAELGDNGRHFLATPWPEWLFAAGELAITQPGKDPANMWTEELHLDGGWWRAEPWA